MQAFMDIQEKNLMYKPEDVKYNPKKIPLIDSHLASLIQRKRITAAGYTLSRDGKVFASRTMGKLRYDEDSPFLPDSIRRVASVTKLFVATSIMQQVERGKLRLDRPVAEIIDEFKNPMYEKITVFHLLTHTSGIRPDPGVFFEPYPRYWNFDNKDWIKEILRDYPAVEPGKEWRYSSAGFTILAEIVSRVSGVPFEKYVIENITKPLGMVDSFFDPPEDKIGRICFSVEWEKTRFLQRKEEKRPEWAPPRGGGGLFSTMGDLQKFGQMLVNKGRLGDTEILSRKAVESMTRLQTPGIKNYCWGAGGTVMEYGLGMNVYSNNTLLSPGSFSHEGAGLCGLFMDPAENFILAYICPLADNVDWEPEAVINLRNLVWSGIE